MEEESWISHSECNTCINSSVCESLGNCILLNIEDALPEYSRKKRKIIQKIKVYGNGSPHQIKCMLKKIRREHEKATEDVESRWNRINTAQGWKEEPGEKEYRTWSGPIRLTVIEKMCIQALNKPR